MKGVIKIIQVAAIAATCILNCNLNGQNLVPNGSFEDTIACAIWNPNTLPCIPWKIAGGSPDYFSNAWCPPYVTMPANGFGFQYAHSGIAYCGFYTYTSQAVGREYIQCPLTSALLSNNYYYVEFYVSVSNTSHFAVDRIGACLTDSAIKGNGYNLINRIPQVENDSGNVITDTLNWTKISGYFYAVGGEQYITIGNFRKDNKTIVDTLSGTELEAHYYIDDVSLIDCTATGINEQTINGLLQLAPNPAINYFTIKSQQNLLFENVSIYSLVGEKVMEQNATGYVSELIMSVAALPKGVYFVKVKTNKGNGFKKFLKM